jgi:carboxyl-terminal processing protease
MQQVFERLSPYVHASHEAWARRSLFWRRMLFPERFTLTLRDGRTVRIIRQDTPPAAGAAPGPSWEVESRWLVPDRVAYVRVPSFDAEAFRDSAVAAVKRMLQAPALVVDVRENGGGTTPVALMELLQDREWRWYEEATPAGAALDRKDRPRQMLRWAAEVLPPAKEPYRGRLVILADGGCFSACEDFLVPFKDNGRATIVGSATGGSSGQPTFFDLGDGMSFRIGTKREYLPDGSEFEGVGILPDVAVEPTVEDIRAERDPVLARGLAIARRDVTPGPGTDRR